MQSAHQDTELFTTHRQFPWHLRWGERGRMNADRDHRVFTIGKLAPQALKPKWIGLCRYENRRWSQTMKTLPVEPTGAAINIGARLRGVRQTQRMTIDQVAELSGLTKGFLSRVERDLTSPSVSTLLRLCEVLSIEVGTLFEVPETKLVRLDQAPRVSLGGDGITEQLVTPRSEKRVQMIRAEIAPKGTGEAELYSVDCELEVLHVIAGRFVLVLPDQRVELEAGDTITFPGREPHSWENESDQIAVVTWTLIL